MESQLHFHPNLIKLDEALAEVDRAGMDVACAAPMLDGRAAFDAASKFIVALGLALAERVGILVWVEPSPSDAKRPGERRG